MKLPARGSSGVGAVGVSRASHQQNGLHSNKVLNYFQNAEVK